MALRFLILGCGWVGEAFAKEMQKRGYQVYATTTQEHKCQRLNDVGIHAFVMDFDNLTSVDGLPQSFDFVLTSVPAVRSLESSTVKRRFEGVQLFLESIEFTKHIFLSSIGIYPDLSGVFTEEFELSETSNLLVAEHLLLINNRTTVYRLGGLFGKNRIFAKYFQNKICTTGYQKANFIHLLDVIELLYLGFTTGLKGQLYNIVCLEHPSKRDVIIASAQKYGLDLPLAFEDFGDFQKIISGEKITQELQYTYSYANPILF